MTAPAPDPVALVERLNRTREWHEARIPINPDGPEAAALIQSQAARIAELEDALKPFAKAGELFEGYQSEFAASIYRPAAGDEYAIDSDHLRQARSLVSGEG